MWGFLRGSRQRLIFNIPKVQMQNAVTCCESPRLSPLVRDKGVARWRTPFEAGISFCFCVESEITILTMITLIITGWKKPRTVAGVFIFLHFCCLLIEQATGNVQCWCFVPEALGSHLAWFKKKKKKRFSRGSNSVRMCVGRIHLYPTHVVRKENKRGETSWWFSICWQLSSPLRVCFGTISWPVARTG